MLSYFHIQNFKSILDLTLDLSFAEGKAPNRYEESDFLPFLGEKNRYVPILALFGANASGKTNVLLALSTFQKIMLSGVTGMYFPDKLNSKYDATTFDICLDLNGQVYVYTLRYNQSGILFERLSETTKGAVLFEIASNDVSFNKIATREYTPQRLKEIFKVECQNEQKQQWLPFLTCLFKNYKRLNATITFIGNYLFHGIEIYRTNNIPLPIGLEKLAKDGTSAAIEEAFNQIGDLLKKLDIDINKMTLNRQYHTLEELGDSGRLDSKQVTFLGKKDNVWIMDEIHTHHTDINGHDVVFNFSEESAGTKTISGILGVCLSALKEGKVLCIDELENSLHPYLLKEIMRLFKDKRYNIKNAQLIFTTHNTDILEDDLIRVSEVGIVTKDLQSGSVMKRISDFGGKRNVNNFRRQYLNGLFCGLPYPYI